VGGRGGAKCSESVGGMAGEERLTERVETKKKLADTLSRRT
jgi:hypothetical protein